MGGRRSLESEVTLDVWDQRLADLGERMAVLRSKLADRWLPLVAESRCTVRSRRGRR